MSMEDYRLIEKMVPASVSRDSAEEAIAAGEIDGAISSLIEEAFEAGQLSLEVLDAARSLKMSGGPGELIEIIHSRTAV